MSTLFYAHGKLLLTAEYLILKGAKALAVPTQSGQSMLVDPIKEPIVEWQSLDEKGNIWLKETLGIAAIKQPNTPKSPLMQLLHNAHLLNPLFLDTNGYFVETVLEFPRDWGLGSSSTWIANIAQWAEVDPYALFWKTFEGSGYDIACANAENAIFYQLVNKIPEVTSVFFEPPFIDNLYFVHLNNKQKTDKEVCRFKRQENISPHQIQRISAITERFLEVIHLDEFQNVLDDHEAIIADCIKYTPVKARLFSDYPYSMKSLGAWGGDFILAVGDKNEVGYFKKKGYETVVPYRKMCFSVLGKHQI